VLDLLESLKKSDDKHYLINLKKMVNHTFGFNPNNKDQRMNFMYFELKTPLEINAIFNHKQVAKGRIFIHIYPSGFFSIIIALRVMNSTFKTHTVEEILNEIKPWRQGQWKWQSRISEGSLLSITKLILENISSSIFLKDESFSIDKTQWHSSYSIPLSSESLKIHERMTPKKLSAFDHGSYRDIKEKIYSCPQGLVYYYDKNRNNSGIMHTFWKIYSLYEFIMYKKSVYECYNTYLSKILTSLKKQQHRILGSLSSKTYSSTASEYLDQLDLYINIPHPYYKRVYSVLSFNYGFDRTRNKTKALLKECSQLGIVFKERNISYIKSFLKAIEKMFTILSFPI